MINIFVGSLDLNSSEDELRALFATHGQVGSVTIVRDRDTGQSRGFAFVEMPNVQEAEQAIRSLHGTLLNQSAIKVNEARPKLAGDSERLSLGSRDHRRHVI